MSASPPLSFAPDPGPTLRARSQPNGAPIVEEARPAHASVLIVGHNTGGAGAVLLGVRHDGRLMDFGGMTDPGDASAAMTAFRELAEELLGLTNSAAARKGQQLLNLAIEHRVLRGPFTSSDGSHAGFAVLADVICGGIGAAARSLRVNDEVRDVVLIPLAPLTGTETTVLDFAGQKQTLRNHLGATRVAAASALLRQHSVQPTSSRALGDECSAANQTEQTSTVGQVRLPDVPDTHMHTKACVY